ncbi:MAG: biotin/lipoyl-containing protein, partial [Phycisphaerales bacterium JB059]
MAHAKSTDPNVFILPDLGEGVHEAELIAWKVKEGDTVEEHQILAEMETDKALVEVPSPRAGTIQTLHGSEGEILNVGNPLVTYVGGGSENGAPIQQASRTEEMDAQEHEGELEAAEEREDAGTVVGAVGGDLGGVSAKDGKALATPAVRRLARDMGI